MEGGFLNRKKAKSTQKIENDIIEWQIYRNNEKGYEVNYPVSWRVENDYFRGELAGEEYFNLHFRILYTDLSLEDFMNKFYSEYRYNWRKIGEYKSTEFNDGNKKTIIFKINNRIIQAISSTYDYRGNEEIVKKIISTFKFYKNTTPQAETPGWKIYVFDNPHYAKSFKIEYPSSASLNESSIRWPNVLLAFKINNKECEINFAPEPFPFGLEGGDIKEEYKNFELNGLKWTETIWRNFNNGIIYHHYSVDGFDAGINQEDAECMQMYKKIISTLKFLK